MSDHLNFDTDFLNSTKATPKPKVNSPKQSGGSGGGNDTVKKWAWGIGIVLGIIVLSALFDDSSSTSTYTPPATPATTQASGGDDNTFTYNGQTFRCSDYHYDKAIALRPNATLSSQLDTEAAGFETRLAALKREKDRIDDMYVDEYDQDSLDEYNAAVDSFNYNNNKYKSDVSLFEVRAEAFDRQIDTYNNYLDANCRPQ
ncbi:MAG: hypothetical protein KBD47_00320 [Candidatus Pacebacteria bacterium]|nr:hypothetical protein [Candidatus Paceibacterota bacterium]